MRVQSTATATHSSLRKSKVLDFSVGNWEKVLLLFTRLPGELYLTLDSTFFIAGTLEEELKSLLKLQVAEIQTVRCKQGSELGRRELGEGHGPARGLKDLGEY